MAPRGFVNIHSIKSRLIAWIFAIFSISLLFTIAGYYITLKVFIAKTTTSIYNNIEQANDYLTLVFQQAKDLEIELSTSDNLQRLTDLYARGESADYAEISDINSLSKDLMHHITLSSEIDSIYIYIPERPILLTSAPDVFLPGYFPVTELPKITSKMNAAYRWVGYYHEPELADRDYLTSVSRADVINRTLKLKTYVVINLDENWINGLFKRHELFDGSRTFLISPAGQVVAADDRNLLNRGLGDALPVRSGSLTPSKAETPGERHGLRRVCLADAGCYRSLYSQSTLTGFSVLTLVPEGKFLYEQRLFLAVVAAGLILATIFYVIMVLRVITDQVDRPISRIVDLMKRVESGSFSADTGENRKDELGYLFAGYNRMVGRLHELVDDLAAQRALNSEIELKFLQAQINPHFLYNTLDTINWIARRNDVPEISEIVRDLSRLYRSAFNRGREEITVREAVEAIRCYLSIQKHRLGDRLDYCIEIADEILDERILNLALQPIIENAVVHGIESGSGHVAVTGERSGNLLLFSISDDGCGMEPAKLELVRESLRCRETHVDSGLINVHRRVRLFYGESSGVDIDSRPGAGTRVELRVARPAREAR